MVVGENRRLCEGLTKRHVRGKKTQNLESALHEWKLGSVLENAELHFMNESSGLGTCGFGDTWPFLLGALGLLLLKPRTANAFIVCRGRRSRSAAGRDGKAHFGPGCSSHL